eukprot:6199203-Pleurochrysis_carterae.AAC.1
MLSSDADVSEIWAPDAHTSSPQNISHTCRRRRIELLRFLSPIPSPFFITSVRFSALPDFLAFPYRGYARLCPRALT